MTTTVSSIPLTPRQRQWLRAVWQFLSVNGRYPTLRELITVMGTSSPNGAITMLWALQKKGYVKGLRRQHRDEPGQGPAVRCDAFRLAGVHLLPVASGEAGKRLLAAVVEGKR